MRSSPAKSRAVVTRDCQDPPTCPCPLPHAHIHTLTSTSTPIPVSVLLSTPLISLCLLPMSPAHASACALPPPPTHNLPPILIPQLRLSEARVWALFSLEVNYVWRLCRVFLRALLNDGNASLMEAAWGEERCVRAGGLVWGG